MARPRTGTATSMAASRAHAGDNGRASAGAVMGPGADAGVEVEVGLGIEGRKHPVRHPHSSSRHSVGKQQRGAEAVGGSKSHSPQQQRRQHADNGTDIEDTLAFAARGDGPVEEDAVDPAPALAVGAASQSPYVWSDGGDRASSSPLSLPETDLSSTTTTTTATATATATSTMARSSPVMDMQSAVGDNSTNIRNEATDSFHASNAAATHGEDIGKDPVTLTPGGGAESVVSTETGLSSPLPIMQTLSATSSLSLSFSAAGTAVAPGPLDTSNAKDTLPEDAQPQDQGGVATEGQDSPTKRDASINSTTTSMSASPSPSPSASPLRDRPSSSQTSSSSSSTNRTPSPTRTHSRLTSASNKSQSASTAIFAATSTHVGDGSSSGATNSAGAGGRTLVELVCKLESDLTASRYVVNVNMMILTAL